MVGHRDFTFEFRGDSSKIDGLSGGLYEVSSHDDSSQCRNQWLDDTDPVERARDVFLLTFASETERAHMETFLTL